MIAVRCSAAHTSCFPYSQSVIPANLPQRLTLAAVCPPPCATHPVPLPFVSNLLLSLPTLPVHDHNNCWNQSRHSRQTQTDTDAPTCPTSCLLLSVPPPPPPHPPTPRAGQTINQHTADPHIHPLTSIALLTRLLAGVVLLPLADWLSSSAFSLASCSSTSEGVTGRSGASTATSTCWQVAQQQPQGSSSRKSRASAGETQNTRATVGRR